MSRPPFPEGRATIGRTGRRLARDAWHWLYVSDRPSFVVPAGLAWTPTGNMGHPFWRGTARTKRAARRAVLAVQAGDL